MKVLIVREECHGLIFVAGSLDAVKRELLRSNWVQGGCSCWNEAKRIGTVWKIPMVKIGKNLIWVLTKKIWRTWVSISKKWKCGLDRTFDY
ncbi:MAG: hypothetical protein J6Q93_06710 [Prevotella sp.]|nr:hypothetical protein [Prevotella sp.]